MNPSSSNQRILLIQLGARFQAYTPGWSVDSGNQSSPPSTKQMILAIQLGVKVLSKYYKMVLKRIPKCAKRDTFASRTNFFYTYLKINPSSFQMSADARENKIEVTFCLRDQRPRNSSRCCCSCFRSFPFV